MKFFEKVRQKLRIVEWTSEASKSAGIDFLSEEKTWDCSFTSSQKMDFKLILVVSKLLI
jgi:hypothetical protein